MGAVSYKKRELTLRLWRVDRKGEIREDTRIELAGHRASVRIESVGGIFMAVSAGIRVWGLSERLMRQFQRTAFDSYASGLHVDGRVAILAGAEGERPALLYEGGIISAVPDYNAAPEVRFDIHSVTSHAYGVSTAAPFSAKGEIDAVKTIEIFARQAGLNVVNYGARSVPLRNVNVYGSTMNKLIQIADAARLTFVIDRGTLSLWPDNLAFLPEGIKAFPVVEIDAEHGMIGYPSFHQNGVMLRCVCNPNIRLGLRVKVKSVVPVASGEWLVSRYQHELETMNPNGPWQTTVRAEVSTAYFDSLRSR